MKLTEKSIIKKTVNIRIIDDDNFFMAGLTIAINNYLKNKKMKAQFYTSHSSGVTVDIIFQAIRCGTLIVPVNHFLSDSGISFYIAIVDRKDAHLQHLYCGLTKSNIFYRHQSVSTILQLIDQFLLASQSPAEKMWRVTKRFTHGPLTPREQEVLHHLKQGKTPTAVASCMGIKEKTISSHKRAAMKKLNFRRTNELLQWLLQRGNHVISLEKEI